MMKPAVSGGNKIYDANLVSSTMVHVKDQNLGPQNPNCTSTFT